MQSRKCTMLAIHTKECYADNQCKQLIMTQSNVYISLHKTEIKPEGTQSGKHRQEDKQMKTDNASMQ